jgi:hypothetical protein
MGRFSAEDGRTHPPKGKSLIASNEIFKKFQKALIRIINFISNQFTEI